MKRVRNKEATCKTCAYWDQENTDEMEDDAGVCSRHPPFNDWEKTYDVCWCGEHPDFWIEIEVPDRKFWCNICMAPNGTQCNHIPERTYDGVKCEMKRID